MNKEVRNRILILTVLVFILMTTYIMRLVDLQIVKGEYYLDQMSRGAIREQSVQAARGEIVDANGVMLTSNRVSYDIIFDRAFMPEGRENEIINSIIELCEKEGIEWVDNLPMESTYPYEFKENSDAQVVNLQTMLGLGTYTLAEDVFSWLLARYELEEYETSQARKIAGVRYSMENADFSITNQYAFARDIPIISAALIKEMGYILNGVDIIETTEREYESKDLIPHILGAIGPIYPDELKQKREDGYIGTDLIGKSGIELLYEEELRGENGSRTIYLSGSGDVTEVIEEEAPTPGNTIKLTIDSEIQRVAMTSLEEQIKFLNETAPEGQGKEADAGAVVAIDVKTGDILSLVTYPGYDQSTYNADYSEIIANPLNPLYNRALLGRYAPGSTFKPAVGIATLNEGIEGTFGTVFCGGVYTHYDDYQPRCLGVHGNINIMEALRVSCNVYFYDVGRRLGIDLINQYASDLGLGVNTGIEFTEYAGRLSSPQIAQDAGEIWTDGRVIASAIGQGYNEFTPLQLANYAATLANRGVRMDVNIVESIHSYSMEEMLWEREIKVASNMDYVEPAYFETVIQGLVNASRFGTAAATFGNYFVDVASKTGTPETAALPNSTFFAFAPADDPEIAIAVVIEKGWHGFTGAPVAKDIFTKYFEIYGEGDTALPEYMIEELRAAEEAELAEQSTGGAEQTLTTGEQ